MFHLLGSTYRELQDVLREGAPPRPSVFDQSWQPETWEAVRDTERTFDGILRLAAERGLRVSVVLIPTLQQVTGAAPATPQEHFLAFFRQRGVDVLDLLPVLRPQDYFPVDQHWTPSGHVAAADAIRYWIAS